MERNLIFWVLSLVLSFEVGASPLEKCVQNSNRQEHRLDKEESLKFCFTNYKSNTNRQECFQLLNKSKHLINTSQTFDELASVCFYETNFFKDVNECLSDTKKFKSSSAHDEALFYCYQNFQEKIEKKECLMISNKMKFPAKKEYLKNHCLDN